jgi:hypothetical protein
MKLGRLSSGDGETRISYRILVKKNTGSAHLEYGVVILTCIGCENGRSMANAQDRVQ